MGVPGDMNLELLDYIDDIEGLEWSETVLISSCWSFALTLISRECQRAQRSLRC